MNIMTLLIVLLISGCAEIPAPASSTTPVPPPAQNHELKTFLDNLPDELRLTNAEFNACMQDLLCLARYDNASRRYFSRDRQIRAVPPPPPSLLMPQERNSFSCTSYHIGRFGYTDCY